MWLQQCITGTPQASLAVDACLRLKDELLAAAAAASVGPDGGTVTKVLFAIDDYSSLYSQTGYGRTDEETGRRVPLQVEDLTLVRLIALLFNGFLVITRV